MSPRKSPAVQSAQSLQLLTTVSKIFGSARPARVVALAPSILSANFANLEADLRKMMRKRVYWTHLDIMDGHFVPNLTIGPPVVKCVRAVSPRLFLDTHLMIEEPLRYLAAFVAAGSDLVNFHAEVVTDVRAAALAVRKAGVRSGVTIKPHTPIDGIVGALDQLDLVLVMTVEPGFGGQSFMAGPLSKVRELARIREAKGLKFLIEVDGGIHEKTAGLAVAAGANLLVAGSAIFGAGRVGDNIERLNRAALA